MNNTLYLRRRNKVYIATAKNTELLPENYIASISKNIEDLGYVLSKPLFDACRTFTLDELTSFYQKLVNDLKQMKGAHRTFKPMYPNFPKQVMEMSELELYINAIFHYWTAGSYIPVTEKEERLPLLHDYNLTVINLGTKEEFEGLFGQIVGSNTSISEQDKEDLTWYVKAYGSDITRFIPNSVPQKENAAYLAGLLLAHVKSPEDAISKFCRTATDVLRLAVAMSDGDVSLAKPTKFRVFKRPERRLLMGLLAKQKNLADDMLRYRGEWTRLGHYVHPGEYAAQYPSVLTAFNVLRDKSVRSGYTTYGSKVHDALFINKDISLATQLLSARPGDFARRLDYMLRTDKAPVQEILKAFASVANSVSTPVLLQVRNHFQNRYTVYMGQTKMRVFFPKGNVAKAKSIFNTLPTLPRETCNQISKICKATLLERFGTLPNLGKCYLDENLTNYLVPFSQRSASKSLRTVVRGSRLPLPKDTDVLRFFVWWKNGERRADIDLSAALFDEKFQYKNVLSYYNLKIYGGWHSGDIVDAPQGASEFIDINISKTLEQNAAYVVMVLISYTGQPYTKLSECFAGWMGRKKANSGEIFEPKTVVDRFDVSAQAMYSIPLIIDLINNEVIWLDMSATNHPNFANNVANNTNSLQAALQSFVDLKKPNVYDLLNMHIEARGVLVKTEEEADTVFSVDNGTPFELETLASEYMK